MIEVELTPEVAERSFRSEANVDKMLPVRSQGLKLNASHLMSATTFPPRLTTAVLMHYLRTGNSEIASFHCAVLHAFWATVCTRAQQ